MAFPPRFLDDLRDRLTLSEVVGRKVKLARAGREYKGCCPFHREKTPSFYVNDDKQFFHCFGCGAHGDAIGFSMRHDNLSFVEAIEVLASEAGLQVPQQSPDDIRKAEVEKTLHTLMEDAAVFFETQLFDVPEHRDAYDYIIGRGIRDETLRAFRVGYAPANDQAMRKYLMAKGYSDTQMLEAALLRPSKRGGDPYPFFRDRIIFPVTDRKGRVIAFGGRVLPENLRPITGDFKPPKYLNSSDTPLFHKGRTLYAQAQAKLAANNNAPVFVVEGYMDVIACHQAGFHGAVAPLGTALTEDQILLLWKMISQTLRAPILCFDGDDAGRRAALRAAERILPLLKADHSIQIAFMPDGDDPDTLILKQGAQGFQGFLDRAISLIDFLWAHHVGLYPLATPEEKAGLAARLDDVCKRIADRTVQQYYQREFRDRQFQLFRTSVKTFQKRSSLLVTLPDPKRKLAYRQDQILLATLLNNPNIYAMVEKECYGLTLSDPVLDEIYQKILTLLEDGERESILQAFSDHPALAEALSDKTYVHAAFAKQGAEPEEAVAGFKDILSNKQKFFLQADIKAAGEALKIHGDDTSQARLEALRKLVSANSIE